jgi:hypothetical protein
MSVPDSHPSPPTDPRVASGWRALAGFCLTFVLAWAASAAWGLAATRLAHWLSPATLARATLGSLLTRGGILLVQVAIWIMATRVFLRRLLADMAFPPTPCRGADLLPLAIVIGGTWLWTRRTVRASDR